MKYKCNIENCEYNNCGNCNYCGDYWSLNDENCIAFIDKNENCEFYDEDNEDSWCNHKENKRHNLYRSCNSKLCPIKSLQCQERRNLYDS